MDPQKAEQLFEQVKGIEIDGISIEELVDNGKSAAVFKGIKEGKFFAIKIFDNDIVRRDDFEIQQRRIELELTLKKHNIPHLVKILGGGKTTINKTEYYYLIMEFIAGKNLKKYIEKESIEINFIIRVINTLIEVTENLLKNIQPLVHRDIKPENIMVSENGEIILMDLGVLKIVNNPSTTDITKKEFLGTLRYAPPEFLARQEEDNEDGWRAVNIYQIGAVLHDLIMKKELFVDIEPFSNLVYAIKDDMPSITSKDYHPDLVQLARDMLQKNWKNRLRTVPINRIITILDKCLLPQEMQENYYNSIKARALPLQEKLADIATMVRSKNEKENLMLNINNNIFNTIDECFDSEENKEIIKEVENSRIFKMDMLPDNIPMRRYRFYKLTGKYEYGFAHPFLILFSVENDESSYSKISLVGIIPDAISNTDISKPEEMMYVCFSRERKYPPPHVRITNPPEINPPLICIFDGIAEFGDNSLKNVIAKSISMLLNNVSKDMEPTINDQLEMKKQQLGLEHNVGIFSGISYGHSFIGIEES